MPCAPPACPRPGSGRSGRVAANLNEPPPAIRQSDPHENPAHGPQFAGDGPCTGRRRPRLGLVILTDLAHKAGAKYAQGKVYDPKSGKTYSAQAELAGNNKLKLRGFIGVSLIGRTSEWTRAQ